MLYFQKKTTDLTKSFTKNRSNFSSRPAFFLHCGAPSVVVFSFLATEIFIFLIIILVIFPCLFLGTTVNEEVQQDMDGLSNRDRCFYYYLTYSNISNLFISSLLKFINVFQYYNNVTLQWPILML